MHKNVPICLVAIDEAHCISSWGHDFRPNYGKLAQLRELLPEVPFIALTATASKIVLNDIGRKLALKNTVIHTTTLNRPNHYYEFYTKSWSIEANLKMFLKVKDQLSCKETFSFGGSCIVYCITKKATERVCKTLTNLGVKCSYYHAGMNKVKRKDVHNQFVKDEIECIVATVAFGMGIDKPDVRMVIHHGAPKEMESYMQEAGRAGRDKKPCRCIVLFSNSDFSTWRNIISKTHVSNLTIKEHRISMLTKVENFLSSHHCRRQQLLEHFDETYNPNGVDPSIRCCDICTRNFLISELNLRLHAIRAKIAAEFNTETEMICSSNIIMEFAQTQSIDLEHLKYQELVPKAFCEKYSPYFLQEVKNFIDKYPEIQSKEISFSALPSKKSHKDYIIPGKPEFSSQSNFINKFKRVLSRETDHSSIFYNKDEPTRIVRTCDEEDSSSCPNKRTKISSNWERPST